MESAGGTTTRFQVLGPFEVLVDGRVVQVGGPKQRAILATLVLRSNEVVSTDVIVDNLWGEQAPRSPRELVRTYVSRLRGALFGAEGLRVAASPPGYVLQVEPATVDAHRFERLVDEARQEKEAGCLDDAVSTLNRGLALWRGDVLADLTEFPSFRPEIARLEEMRLVALEQRIDADLALGRHTEVLGELAALTAEHPLRERFWGQLVVALYRSGRQTDALAAYQTLRSTLVEQIGIDPSPELRALEQEVLNQADELSWRPLADRNAGSRPGPTEPARRAPSGDASGAASGPIERPTEGEPRPEWPVQVGRPPTRAAAFQLRKTLVDEVHLTATGAGSTVLPQVVLVGNGGVGKTQLAADRFSKARTEGTDLLVWVNASSRRSIVVTYAQARRKIEPSAPRSESTDDAAEAFLGWLGATSRSWLVVLDDVADPLEVQGLWPEGRSGRVLATTRRRDLSPAGARQVAVEGFTPSDACSYLQTRLTGSQARPVHPDVLDEGAMLAEDLGWLPVALAQASAVILNEGITSAEFRRRFADRAEHLRELLPADATADDYHHEVSTAWSLALERADALHPVGLSRPALHVAAVLDPDGVPDSVWDTSSARRFLSGQRDGAVVPAGDGAHRSSEEPDTDVPATMARRALRNLHRLSLVTHDPAGGP